jgi:putative flippase GtrA
MVRVTRSLATGAVPIAELRAEFGRNTSPRIGGQLARFALVGAVSTIAYLALFLLLRGSAGAFGANLLALAITAVGNTAANRRLTFGFRGRDRAARHYGEGLAVFALGLALSTGALALVPSAAGASVQLTALVGANVVTTLLRFVLLRTWVFSPRRNTA